MKINRSLTALSHCLAELSTLSFPDAHTQRFKDWHAYTVKTLAELPGNNAPALAEFNAIRFVPPLPAALDEQEATWRTGRNAAYTLLTTLRFRPYTTPNELDAPYS